jgi:hypothetical protein
VHPAIARERDTGKQKQLRENLMKWLHLHASKRENAKSSGFLSRSSSTDSVKSSLLSAEMARLTRYSLFLLLAAHLSVCRKEAPKRVSLTSTFTRGRCFWLL